MPIPISISIINTVLLTVRVLSIIYIKDKGNMQARQKTYNKSGEEGNTLVSSNTPIFSLDFWGDTAFNLVNLQPSIDISLLLSK